MLGNSRGAAGEDADPIVDWLGGRRRRTELLQRNDEPRRKTQQQSSKTRLRHADDRENRSIRLNGFSDDVRIGIESASPQGIGKKSNALRAWTVGFDRERMPDLCANTERIETIAGHREAADAASGAIEFRRHSRRREAANAVENRFRAQAVENLRWNASRTALLVQRSDVHQLVRLVHRNRPQEKNIDQAEDRYVRTDS